MIIGKIGFSILILISIIIAIILIRPSFLIDEATGDWKCFGFGDGKSCINITSIVILSSMIVYLIVSCAAQFINSYKGSSSVNVLQFPAFHFPE